MAIKVLALDLEQTLISDAMNREPRPGLFSFLAWSEDIELEWMRQLLNDKCYFDEAIGEKT